MDTCVHSLELKANVRPKWLKNVKDQVKLSLGGIIPHKNMVIVIS